MGCLVSLNLTHLSSCWAPNNNCKVGIWTHSLAFKHSKAASKDIFTWEKNRTPISGIKAKMSLPFNLPKMGTPNILHICSLADCQLLSKEKKLPAAFTQRGTDNAGSRRGQGWGLSASPHSHPRHVTSSASLDFKDQHDLVYDSVRALFCADRGCGVLGVRITRRTPGAGSPSTLSGRRATCRTSLPNCFLSSETEIEIRLQLLRSHGMMNF